jgi:hypothetical protein
MLAGKRASSAMDGKLKSVHGAWIRQLRPALPYLLHPCSRPAIHAGMTMLLS